MYLISRIMVELPLFILAIKNKSKECKQDEEAG